MAQAGHDDPDQAPHPLFVGLQFQIVLYPGGGETGAEPTIDEGGTLEDFMDLINLGGIEQAGDSEKHDGWSPNLNG
jgi:hypothetical protein